MNDTSATYDEVGEFWQELTSTIKEMVHNLASQSVGLRQDSSIDRFIALCALLFFILIFILIISHFIHAHNKKKTYSRFDNMLSCIQSDSQKKELKKLIAECVELGEKIDVHMGRDGCSKKISMLVFMMAKQMNLDFTETVLFFCASLVHDAGYLDSPAEIFCCEILSLKEKKVLHSHIHRALNYINFVPKQYIVPFMSAITYHHENMDGSGYPDGLSADEIPLCARMIHVAEDYIYMIEKTAYNKPLDRDKALLRLKKADDVYDSRIVNVLENLLENTVI